MAHVSDDENNVIYANFGKKTRVSRADEVPQIDTTVYGPAGARMWQAVTAQADQGRITRGKQYFQAGHVLKLDIRSGSVEASVAGSQNDPFTVNIVLPYRSTDDLHQVSSQLARMSGGISKARRGDLSSEILDVLLADDTDDIAFSCTCPDYARACKHAVAASARLAEKMDVDRTIVFQLRGINLDELEKMVLAESESMAQEATAPGSDLFFTGRELPDLPEPRTAAAIDDSDLDLLHKAMRAISFTNVDQLRAVADIEDLYDHLLSHD